MADEKDISLIIRQRIAIEFCQAFIDKVEEKSNFFNKIITCDECPGLNVLISSPNSSQAETGVKSATSATLKRRSEYGLQHVFQKRTTITVYITLTVYRM